MLVSRTRSRTAPEVVERAGGGYRLGLEDSDVDAMKLTQLVGEARAAAAAGDLDLGRVYAKAALAITAGGAGEERDP